MYDNYNMKQEAKLKRKLNPNTGRGSSVGIGIWYGLNFMGTNTGVGEIFRTRQVRLWVPPFLCTVCTGTLLKLTIFVGLHDISVFIMKRSSMNLIPVRKYI
jgi:hypothetical protein